MYFCIAGFLKSKNKRKEKKKKKKEKEDNKDTESMYVFYILTFTMLCANSADDKLMIFLENRICHFMQIVSLGDSLHEVTDPIS